MPSTPRHKLHYPAPTDPPDGPNAIRELAEKVEAALQRSGTYTPAWVSSSGTPLAHTAPSGKWVAWPLGDGTYLIYANASLTATNTSVDGAMTLPTNANDWTWAHLKVASTTATDVQLDGRTTPGANRMTFQAGSQGWRNINAGSIVRMTALYTSDSLPA